MTKEYGTPGPRALHPDVCHSRSLRATKSLLAMLLMDRLVAAADDQGRLSGDASDIRITCLANALDLTTDAKVDAALNVLAEHGHILRYQVDDQPYVQLAHWWTWQGGQRRAYPSRHPAPEGWEDRVYGVGPAAHGRPAQVAEDGYGHAQGGATQHNGAQGGDGPPAAALPRGRPRAEPRAEPRAPGALTVPDTVPLPRAQAGAGDPGGPRPLRDILEPPPGYVPPKTRGAA